MRKPSLFKEICLSWLRAIIDPEMESFLRAILIGFYIKGDGLPYGTYISLSHNLLLITIVFKLWGFFSPMVSLGCAEGLFLSYSGS